MWPRSHVVPRLGRRVGDVRIVAREHVPRGGIVPGVGEGVAVQGDLALNVGDGVRMGNRHEVVAALAGEHEALLGGRGRQPDRGMRAL
jgi:hypothetical protein